MIQQGTFTMTRSRRFVRAAVAAVWAGALAVQMGCYSYQPIQSAPPMGKETDRVAIVVNDRGRTLLADRVGPLVDQIEGRIDKRENGSVTMAVFRVKDVRGDYSTWTGEQVKIPDEAVLGYRPRKISKSKTALFVGVVAAAIAATLRTSLNIFGLPPSERAPTDPPLDS